MPIIVGAPRSGTTLLRFMLDASPLLAIPPETGFLTELRRLDQVGAGPDQLAAVITHHPPEAPTWPDFGLDAEELTTRLQVLDPWSVAAGVRQFYGAYAELHGKPRWGDKTPGYVQHLAEIAAVLPEARFVHLIRDGRDVAVSLRQRWFSPGHAIETQAAFWAAHVRAGRAQARSHDLAYLELRYEDLIAAPERELRRVCEFVELPFDEAMLRSHERAGQRLVEHRDRHRADGSLVVSHAERVEQQALTMRVPDLARIGGWRSQLAPGEAEAFEVAASGLLTELGYPA